MKKIAQCILVCSFILSTFSTPLSVALPENNTGKLITLTTNQVYAQACQGSDGTPIPLGDNNDTKCGELGGTLAAGSTSTGQADKTNSVSETENHNEGGYLKCGVWDFACKGINFLQMIFIGAGNFLVGISTYVMDIFLSHSLQSSPCKDAGFIEQGWEILRDMKIIS